MELDDAHLLSMDERTWRQYVNQKFEESGAWRSEHQQALEENTVLTKQIAHSQMALVKDTSAIVEALQATQTGVRFMTKLGWALHKFARWLLPIAALCGTVWAALNGHWPRGE